MSDTGDRHTDIINQYHAENADLRARIEASESKAEMYRVNMERHNETRKVLEAILNGYRERESYCKEFTKAIQTWMPEGFKSHCVDAMLIMDGRIAKVDKENASLREAIVKCREAGLYFKHYSEHPEIGREQGAYDRHIALSTKEEK